MSPPNLSASGQEKDAAFGDKRGEWCVRQNVTAQIYCEAGYAVATGAGLSMADRLTVNTGDQYTRSVRREDQTRLSGWCADDA